LDGEERTFDDVREVEHYGDLPLGCQANLDPYLMGNASKMFTCTKIGDSAIGGTIRLKSAKPSPPVDFLPGDQVNIKFSLENKMYGDEAFLIKYKIMATGITPMDGAERVKVTTYLSTGANDINLHLFDLTADATNNVKPFSYVVGAGPTMKGTGQETYDSTITSNLVRLQKTGTTDNVFYVNAGNIDLTGVTFSLKGSMINLNLSNGKTIGLANVDLNSVIIANNISFLTLSFGNIDGVTLNCDGSNNDKTVTLIYNVITTSDSKQMVKYNTSNSSDYVCKIKGKNGEDVIVKEGVNLQNTFPCNKEGVNFKCENKLSGPLNDVTFSINNPSGDMTLGIYASYPGTKLFPITFTASASSGNLPAKYPKGQYTMYATMYRDSNDPGYREGDDTLLPYGPKNQTEEIKFMISDATNPTARPNIGVIFPPEDYQIACDKGNSDDGKGLLIGLNVEHFMSKKLYFNISISGGSNTNLFSGEIDKVDNLRNKGVVGSGVDAVGFGNYMILLPGAFIGLNFRAQTGSTTVKIDFYDNIERTGNPISKLLNVYAVDGGSDCRMGITSADAVSISSTGSSGTAIITTADDNCRNHGGNTSSTNSANMIDICKNKETATVGCPSSSSVCLFDKCPTNNTAIKNANCIGFSVYTDDTISGCCRLGTLVPGRT
jgi:hypothetical protein